MSAPTTQSRSLAVLAGLLGVVFANAAASGWATATSVRTWYVALDKPAWTPPGWVFGPAWTLLYTAMAVVAWRIWRRPELPARGALLRLWWTQLALNAAWSWTFFYFRQPGAGMAVITALFVSIGLIQRMLARTPDRVSTLLWLPYVLWVAFASTLNLWIWLRN